MTPRACGRCLLLLAAAVCVPSPTLLGTPAQKSSAPDTAPILDAFAKAGRTDHRFGSRSEAVAFIEAWPAGAGRWIDAATPADRTKQAQVAALGALVLARTVFDRLEETSQTGLRGQLLQAAHVRLRSGSPSEFERLWLLASTDFLLSHGLDDGETAKHLQQAHQRFPADGRLTVNRTLLDRDVITLVSTPGTPPDLLKTSLAHGDREFMQENYRHRRIAGRAGPVFATLLGHQDVGHEAAARLGWLRFHEGALAESLPLFRQAKSGSSDGYVRNLAAVGLGLTHLAEGRASDALDAFRDAVAALPTARTSTTALAMQLFLLGQRQEAATLLDGLAGKSNPIDPWKHVGGADRFVSVLMPQLYGALGIAPPAVIVVPQPDAVARAATPAIPVTEPVEPPRVSGRSADFSVRTTLVAVDASVMDGRKPVNGLTASDFEVRDNGVRQEVESVSVEGLALDVSVVLDLRDISYAVSWFGDSRREQIFVSDPTSQGVRDTAQFSALLRPDDRLRIITATRDVAEPHPLQGPGGRAVQVVPRETMFASALYDAVATALMRPASADRRHLVLVFTDGMDGASIVTGDELRRAAAEADALIHVFKRDTAEEFFQRVGVGHLDRTSQGLLRPLDHSVLNGVASATGGAVERVPSTGHTVVADVKRMLESFRQRYVLRYRPTGVEPGGWHNITVRVMRPGRFTVEARRGYFGG